MNRYYVRYAAREIVGSEATDQMPFRHSAPFHAGRFLELLQRTRATSDESP